MSIHSVKPVFKCPSVAKAQFAKSSALLTVSVGQEVHEGDKFAAYLKLVDQSFERIVICVDDTLQRHSMVLGGSESPESFYAYALEQGDRWVDRSSELIHRLRTPCTVVRWGYWLRHPDYERNRGMILSALEADTSYEMAFRDSVDAYLTRHYNRSVVVGSDEYQRDFQRCIDYLVEECTAMTLWPELGCQFEVYPSRRNEAMAATHHRFVLPEHPDLLHPVGIKFKRRAQLFPQQFLRRAAMPSCAEKSQCYAL